MVIWLTPLPLNCPRGLWMSPLNFFLQINYLSRFRQQLLFPQETIFQRVLVVDQMIPQSILSLHDLIEDQGHCDFSSEKSQGNNEMQE